MPPLTAETRKTRCFNGTPLLTPTSAPAQSAGLVRRQPGTEGALGVPANTGGINVTGAPDHDLTAHVVQRREPHGVFVSESATEVLRHLQTEGREAVPVLSESGRFIVGWATGHSVLRAVAERLAVRAPASSIEAGDPEPGRSTLPGHHILEIAATAEYAGRHLGDIDWPPGYVPVSVTRQGHYREARDDLSVREGDVLGLLVRG